MLRRIYHLFKIARKLGCSGAIETINEIYNIPLSIKLFFNLIAIGSTKENINSFYANGISHAHNSFLQVLADQGLIAFLLLIFSFWLMLWRLFVALQWDDLGVAWTGLACVFLILIFAIVGSTLIKTSLQQVVTGYLLSMALMCPSGKEEEEPI